MPAQRGDLIATGETVEPLAQRVQIVVAGEARELVAAGETVEVPRRAASSSRPARPSRRSRSSSRS